MCFFMFDNFYYCCLLSLNNLHDGFRMDFIGVRVCVFVNLLMCCLFPFIYPYGLTIRRNL